MRYHALVTDLARRALAVNRAMLALANETFSADGATFVRNRSLPEVRDANHVTNVTASGLDEIDRLLDRVEREFAGLAYRRFDLDFTTPPAFEARLLLDGYERSDTLVLVLEGDLVGHAKRHDIRPITDEAGWHARAALNEAGWREYTERLGKPEEMQAALRSGRDKAPPMRYWLAYLDGEARAYCASWGGIDGIGQVEYLFTHPQSRHRGLATALIHRCVADGREQGAGPVVITANASDTPKEMYAALGFRPVAVKRAYGKDVEA
jgi:GNAT superfamily N-acetyltransferase